LGSRDVIDHVTISAPAHRPFPIAGPLERIESLNPAVFEILRSKRIGVTSLTFQGHVTLSVTSAFDSPYAISYWWPFGTKSLSLTVSEIFNVKCNAMFDVTLIRPLNKGQDHSFWYQSISHIRLTAIIQITSQTTLGVLQLCLGTPLREGQNLVGACTTQIHTHGSWNEAAAISHSSCTVRFISTLEKKDDIVLICWKFSVCIKHCHWLHSAGISHSVTSAILEVTQSRF